jgi:Zn-dependent protease with chaperone function
MSHAVLRAPWHAVVGVPLLVCLVGVAQYLLLSGFPPAGVAATACMALAMLGAVLGATGIVMTHRLAGKGMASRSILVGAFATWHARLPGLLTWQLLAVGSAFAAASCSMMIWGFVSHDIRFGVIMTGFTGVTVLMIWIAVTSARQQALPFEPKPMNILAHAVTRTDAPALWAMTDEVAATLGATPLDHIIIGLLDGFFVTSGPVRASHAGELQGHTLYLGAAHLPWLDAGELRGIVAHELAHFSGRDLAYSERFAPIYHGFERRVVSLAEYENDDWVGKIFLRPGRMVVMYALQRFRAVERHWSRVREHEADKAGAALVGARVYGTALTRAVLLETRLHQLLAALGPSGEVRDDVIEQLRLSIADTPLSDLGDHRMAHPFDAHPVLAERLEAIGLPLDSTVQGASARRSPVATGAGTCHGILSWRALAAALSDALHDALRRANRNALSPSSLATDEPSP